MQRATMAKVSATSKEDESEPNGVNSVGQTVLVQ